METHSLDTDSNGVRASIGSADSGVQILKDVVTARRKRMVKRAAQAAAPQTERQEKKSAFKAPPGAGKPPTARPKLKSTSGSIQLKQPKAAALI